MFNIMKSKPIFLSLFISLFICQISLSQVSFIMNTSDTTIVEKLFETKYNEKDSTFKWIPNLSERIQFDTTIRDTLRTKIDTVFNYNDSKIILTTTYKFNDICHSCQPVLGIIELMSNEAKDSINVNRLSKFVARCGTWGEPPKKRSVFQLGEFDYCIKITEYYSGGGVEGESTFLLKDGKKIFSFLSYLNETAFENENMNSRFSASISYDKKTNKIKIIKKGKEANNAGKIAKVNSITTYKYDGEFLEKISTVNILPKK